MGRRGQLLWPARRHRSHGAVRYHSAAAAAFREDDTTHRGIGRAAFTNGRRCDLRLLVGPGCSYGPAVGALRRSDSRAAADRCGPERRQPRHDIPASRLCRRRRDIPGRCPADRRQGLHRHETIAWGRRMDTARARHRCARRGCRDRFRLRHRIACASLAGEHERRWSRRSSITFMQRRKLQRPRMLHRS